MDDDKKGAKTSVASIPILLLISALAGSLFLGPSPLITSRPEGTKRNMTGTLGTQDVEARLWQDPFEALELAGVTTSRAQDVNVFVGKNPELTLKGTVSIPYDHDIKQLTRQIEVRYEGWNPEITGYEPKISFNKQVQVILAMVSGGPYAEDIESRIRSRVALMAALGTAGYRSDDEDQIGYVTADWPLQLIRDHSDSLTPEGWSKLIMPYEWFTRRIHHADRPQPASPKSNHVLVLWLRDDLFGEEPLYRLNELIGYFRRGEAENRCQVSVLGPRTSTTLREFFPLAEWDYPLTNEDALTETMQRQVAGRSGDWLTSTRIFSWAATTMEGLLVPNGETPVPDGTPTETQIHHRLQKLGIEFFNITCTDDALASCLLRELARRGADPRQEETHIALISEWDTFYGRTMPLTFAYDLCCIGSDCPEDVLQRLRFRSEEYPKQLHWFSYLQGIDGKLSARSPQISTEPKVPADNSKDKERRTPEVNRAEGPSQLDYIPRLADQIARLSQRLQMEPARPGIRAIGILGSDVYDKLLALQALRPRFPDAIFFTTDLDARLWHPGQLKWTRNMIVAASFGLELKGGLQQDIPPFRDSYQTAQYLACLSALGVVSPETLKTISPRLFEIGRDGATDLSDSSVSPDVRSPNFIEAIMGEWQTLQNPPREDPIYPPARIHLALGWSITGVLLLTLSLVLALVLLGRVSPILRRFVTNRNEALKRELLIKTDDVRDETQLVAAIRKWLSKPAWKSLLSEKFVKALEPANEVSSASSSALSHESRLTIIDGLNDLIQARNPLPATVEALPGTGAPMHGQQLTSKAAVRKKWLQQMIENRRAIENAIPGALFSFGYPFAITLRSLSNFARFGWIAPAAMLVVFLLAVLDNQTPGAGEPFSWTSGVSAWPTQLLRVLTIGLAIGFLLRGEEDLRRNQLELSRRFLLPGGYEDGRPRGGNRISLWLRSVVAVKAKNLWRKCPWVVLPEKRARRVISMASIYLVAMFASLRPLLRGYEDRRPRGGNRISEWLHSAVAVRAKKLWREYRWLGQRRKRATRVIFMATVYILALLTFVLAFGNMPLTPIRGVICNTVNLILLWTVVIVTIFLNFFVVDATRLCQHFIQNLNTAPTIYPKKTLRKFRGGVDKAADDDLDDWLDMQIIAARSVEVSRLIYYPFITLFLLVLARARYWDDWPWQPLLILIFVFNAAWAVSSAVVLQRSAKAARARALESLRQKISRVPESGSELRLKRFTKMQEDISALNSGAFAGYLNNPILGALSLPLTGTAIAFIVEFLTRG